MLSSPRAISRSTKSSTTLLSGNSLASAVNFADASLAFSVGHRSSTASSEPLPPGHGRAAEVATAEGLLTAFGVLEPVIVG